LDPECFGEPFDRRQSDARPTLGLDVLQVAVGDAREFGAAASIAVAQWKLEPGLKHGKPVATHVQVPVVFALDDGKK
jgi:hypothetical protein